MEKQKNKSQEFPFISTISSGFGIFGISNDVIWGGIMNILIPQAPPSWFRKLIISGLVVFLLFKIIIWAKLYVVIDPQNRIKILIAYLVPIFIFSIFAGFCGKELAKKTSNRKKAELQGQLKELQETITNKEKQLAQQQNEINSMRNLLESMQKINDLKSKLSAGQKEFDNEKIIKSGNIIMQGNYSYKPGRDSYHIDNIYNK